MSKMMIFIVFLLAIQIHAQNVGIGTSTPTVTLEVNSPSNIFTSKFNGPNQMFIGLTENDILRGYVGSYSGSPEDFDIGTSNNNISGKLHLTTLAQPRMTINNAGNVGVGTTFPHTSALLDVSSTTKGFLPPRMSKSQRDAIVSSAEGLIISCTDCPVEGLYQYINGSWQSFVLNSTGNYGTVVNPVTGKVWLDRNLGATQVATSSTDAASYGDLFQWGRGADGHQLRTSLTITSRALNWYSGSFGAWLGRFILTYSNWLDITPLETHMWSGTAAENNPCPCGFRIPTNAEWYQEINTWATKNAAGAFASVLRLPLAGRRDGLTNGVIEDTGVRGNYWSSTVNGSGTIASRYLTIHSSNALTDINYISYGFSIRCIKD